MKESPLADSNSKSIFQQIYGPETFVDRYLKDPGHAVDVIVPIIHTNELWEKNLISFYREIPINRLLISDGGCVDDSLEIAKRFPRVKILDHREVKSLGFCIRRLIEEVETEWFIYPHSDVYLPENWFDKMVNHQNEYDWFGCPMRHLVIVEYPQGPSHRPYAGSQMGRKKAFIENLHKIDDDYVYRQEDYVFERVVTDGGHKCGKVEDIFHYHQTMHKVSKWGRKVKGVTVDVEMTPEENARTAETQARGIIKYLHPDRRLANTVMVYLSQMVRAGKTDVASFMSWTKKVNPEWIPYLSPVKIRIFIFMQGVSFGRLRDFIKKLG